MGLLSSYALAQINLWQGLSLTYSVYVNSVDKRMLASLQGEVGVELMKLMDLKSI